MIQLRRPCPDFSVPPARLHRLRGHFDRHGCVTLRRFLHPDLLRLIQGRVDKAPFHRQVYAGRKRLATELCMKLSSEASVILLFLMNQPGLLQAIRSLTGCSRIRSFVGRAYRLVPGRGDTMRWHTDWLPDQGRLVGLSVNLSRAVYQGGMLQIRERASARVIGRVSNVGFGDAVIFRISPKLMHRVTDIEGRVAKTAWAGWFISTPLRGKSRRKRTRVPQSGWGRDGSTHLTSDSCVRISEEAFHLETQGGLALLHLKRGHYCGLNPEGGRIWELLVRHGSLRKVFRAMRKEYRVSPDRLEKDLLRLVGDLRDAGFVKVRR